MAADVYSVARNLFAWAKGDQMRISQVQEAFDAAVSGGALTKGGMDSVSSASKNGVSMTKLVGLDEGSRQTTLRLALQWLDAGRAPVRGRSLGRF